MAVGDDDTIAGTLAGTGISRHAGDKFLTMELIDGVALTADVGRRMEWARLRRLAVQICDGLAAAHRAGVIHRDLKPDNVLVERGTDRAVITDFGIARSADDVGVTQIGTVIGTPRYMAPEQLAGSPDVDARADLFSLGVMLYELASGTRPWEADRACRAGPPGPRCVRPLDAHPDLKPAFSPANAGPPRYHPSARSP